MGGEFRARLKLVHKLNEGELDSLFYMFETIGTKMYWPEDEWAFLFNR